VSDSRHILLLVGIPGSGKSTFAKEHVREHPDSKRVNKDELRFMIHDEDFSTFDRRKEDFVVACRDHVIRQALKDGYNVLVDDTNIEVKHYTRVLKIAETFAQDRGIAVTVQVKVFDTPLDECLRRNALRVGKMRIPDEVIRKMFGRLRGSPLLKTKGVTFGAAPTRRLYTPGLPECIVTDMDGTASLLGGRNPYDARGCINDPPNVPVIGLLRDLMDRYAIIVVSGREDKDQAETEEWLRSQGVRFYDPSRDTKLVGIVAVHLRKTGDQRKDAIIKREIYEAHILPYYNIKFVLDDRNQVVEAIRGMGIPVFQVAPGDF
jgi:predicted kinase